MKQQYWYRVMLLVCGIWMVEREYAALGWARWRANTPYYKGKTVKIQRQPIGEWEDFE